jgi:hypothetical protein
MLAQTAVMRLTRSLKSAVLLLCALIAASLATASVATATFRTPGKAAYCGVSEGEPPLSLICWRPGDGLTLSMTRAAFPRRRLSALNRGYHATEGQILLLGKVWRLSGYWKCVSRVTGLTCTNKTGHGWWLGRARGSRLF